MKHYLHNSLRALFLSLAVLLSLPMMAEQVEIDGINYGLNAETKQATVIAKSSGKYSGEVVIPESVEHEGAAYSVTSIGNQAFYSCSGLTSVTIGNSVTSIGVEAFRYCSDLTSVTIGNSVTSIGDGAFYACDDLTSVTIDNSVTSIGDYAFYSCSGLTSVTIGNSVTSIGYSAFSHCSGLTSVTIPNSVTSIGYSAFSGCHGLTSIVVEDGNPVYDSRNNCNAIIETATNTLHSGCKTTIIPNSVTSIGDHAFSCCSGLTSVTIPNSVESIGSYAFYECSGLTSVTIGNSVTSIGYRAFYECSGLTSVTIPNSVKSIGVHTFGGCTGLTSVTIGNSVTSIGGSAFSECSGLTSVHISDIVAWCNIDFVHSSSNPLEYAHHLYLNGEEVKDLVIPNSVTSIGEGAFLGCSGLTSVTIPNSVTSIGRHAFDGCSGLTSVHISDIAAWCNIDFESNYSNPLSYAHHLYLNGEEVKDLVIPNTVTSIRARAFEDYSGLTSVTIPNSVTSIGGWAFRNCSKLLDVYCYAEKVPSTVSNAFDGSYPENATLHVPAASIDSYKATAPWSSFGKIVALPNEFNLSVSSVGYATLFLDFNAEIPANVQAYTGVKVVDNSLKMERIEGVLPANTGVIIKADEGTYTFAESDATPVTIDDNLLYGTVATTQISTDPSYSYYVLSEVDGIVGMYLAKLTDSKFQNNANKAYMMLKKGDLGIYDEEVDTGTEQLSRGFVFDFGEETSIDELKGENGTENSAVYDLSGRRVQKAQKGIFIQNGKVMIK